MEPPTIEQLKKDKKLPQRVDWISGNPKQNRFNRLNDDYEKTIYEIKDDQTIVTGTVVKKKNGGPPPYTYDGTFRTAGGFKTQDQLTDADKKAITDDFDQERSNITNQNPGILAFVIPPPPGDSTVAGNNNDVDGDGVPNGRDDCPVVYDPAQTDSVGNGIGDACRTVLLCDTDGNGVIDIFDISNITAARGLPAARSVVDPRDVDGDGIITVNDARICTQRCTNKNCAPI